MHQSHDTPYQAWILSTLPSSTAIVAAIRRIHYLLSTYFRGKVGLENILNLNRYLCTEEPYQKFVETNFFPEPFQLCAKMDLNLP